MRDERLAIALLSPSFPPAPGGGVASSHYNLFLGLLRAGAEVEAFLFRSPPGGAAPIAGGTVHATTAGPRAVATLPRLFRLALRVTGERGQADQFSETLPNILVIRGLRRQLDRCRPRVLILADRGAIGAWLPKRRGEKWILVMHHLAARFGEEPLLGPVAPTDLRLATWLDQRALERADTVVCPSQFMARALARTHHVRAPVHVIPNGIDLAALDASAASSGQANPTTSAGARTVYLPGLGTEAKGRRVARELVHRIATGGPAELRFYISGAVDDALRRELALASVLDRCVLPGRLPYREHLALMRTCCLCVTPSLIENFSMTVLEAMACRLPVVAFATGGIPEAVPEETAGRLTPYMDVEGLAREACALLDDEPRRRRMGEGARAHVQQHYDIRHIAARYLALCQDLAPLGDR